MRTKNIVLLVALFLPALVGAVLVLIQGKQKAQKDDQQLDQLAKAREASIIARRKRAEERKKELEPEPVEPEN
jgi:hypothetical protein